MTTLASGTSIYLDSNIAILAIERGSKWTAPLRQLFEEIEKGDLLAFSSEIALAEVLAKPLELGAADVAQQFEALFADDSPLVSVPVDRPILRRAAQLRGDLGATLVDAIHVATAVECECNVFLTNDYRLGRKLTKPVWWSLDDLESGKPGDA